MARVIRLPRSSLGPKLRSSDIWLCRAGFFRLRALTGANLPVDLTIDIGMVGEVAHGVKSSVTEYPEPNFLVSPQLGARYESTAAFLAALRACNSAANVSPGVGLAIATMPMMRKPKSRQAQRPTMVSGWSVP
jgi:hypothetical protein